MILIFFFLIENCLTEILFYNCVELGSNTKLQWQRRKKSCMARPKVPSQAFAKYHPGTLLTFLYCLNDWSHRFPLWNHVLETTNTIHQSFLKSDWSFLPSFLPGGVPVFILSMLWLAKTVYKKKTWKPKWAVGTCEVLPVENNQQVVAPGWWATEILWSSSVHLEGHIRLTSYDDFALVPSSSVLASRALH